MRISDATAKWIIHKAEFEVKRDRAESICRYTELGGFALVGGDLADALVFRWSVRNP